MGVSLRLKMIVSVLLVVVVGLKAQDRSPWDAAITPVLKSLTVIGNAGTYLGGSGYGMVGTAGIGYPLSLISSQPEDVFFGHRATVELTFGSGFLSRPHDPTKSLSIETAGLGLNVPVLTPLETLDLALRPSVEMPVMSDHLTGYRDWVATGSLGVRLDLGLTSWIQVTTEYRRSWSQPHGFLWANHFGSLHVGLSFQLSEAFSEARQLEQASEGLRVALTQTEDSLAIQREMIHEIVRHENGNSSSEQVVNSLKGLAAEVKNLRTDLKIHREFDALATIRELPTDGQPRVHAPRYDETKIPRVRRIAVARPLFSGGDLIEEDYLKSVLATLNNYDGYVWAIAYRDSGSSGTNDGPKLAEKLRDFFRIYNSNFDRRLCLVHDATIERQFEFRCLGMSVE